MTDLVSLLFIAMIPIDYKITIFSLNLFIYFLLIYGKFPSATSNERMTTNIIFAGATQGRIQDLVRGVLNLHSGGG